MKYDTIRWRNGKVELLDQTLLPGTVKYVKCSTDKEIYHAIKTMIVRGAPAIGVTGAYGVYLGIKNISTADEKKFKRALKRTVRYIDSSRPTARNLFWASGRMHAAGLRCLEKGNIAAAKKALLKEAHDILKEDVKICRKIGENGKKLFTHKSSVLTHCNAGALATAGYGTALGVIFSSRNNIKMVFADETRPVLQGARLTVWELLNAGIPTTLICDNMAGSIMAKGLIDAVVVGADRIVSNGDTANKIGTYSLAVLAKHHRVPFYVAAPFSTFDLSLKDGSQIPIEERDPDEVRTHGGKQITCAKVRVMNPSFDVTPASMITAIITERGVIMRPSVQRIKKIMGK